MLYLTSKTVNLLWSVWKGEIRIDSGLGYLAKRIPSKLLWIEFVNGLVEGEFSVFSFVDSTNRNYSMRRSQYESRIKYVVGEIFILFTNDNLLFEVCCVYLKFIELVSGCEGIKFWLFSIPQILVWRLKDKFLLWVLINKTTHFFHLPF